MNIVIGFTFMRFSVVGLGKVGTCMVAGIASRGCSVIGHDVLSDNVANLKNGKSHILEPGLSDLLSEYKDYISATESMADLLSESDVTFVIVPTPSNSDGSFSLDAVLSACEEIGVALRDKDEYHLIVITSTILPGNMRSSILPAIEAASGKSCGENFGLCYSPSFIAIGNILHDFLEPDFFLIGESDVKAGDLLEKSYDQICVHAAPKARMSWENAELTKIAVNSYVTMKITFANTIGEICSVMETGDADKVCEAIGLDKRIGSKFLKAGGAYGGPCFPRDNKALAASANKVNVHAKLSRTVDDLNESLTNRIIGLFNSNALAQKSICIIGLAYKTESYSAEESQGVKLMFELERLGCNVMGYDKLAAASAREILGDEANITDDIYEAITSSDFLILVNPTPEMLPALKALDANVRTRMEIYDLWRSVDSETVKRLKVEYTAFGQA